MKQLNQYQFNEWRPNIIPEVQTYGHAGMLGSLYSRGDESSADKSLTDVEGDTYAWEWHNPARKEVISENTGAMAKEDRNGEWNGEDRYQSTGFSSRREAHNAAMDFMLDKTGGKPERLGGLDSATMSPEDVSRWEHFHKGLNHEIKYEG